MADRQKEKVDETTYPQCGSDHIHADHGRGEMVHETCGLVPDDAFIDQAPERCAIDSEQRQKRAHTGAPHDKGLSTMIGRNKDSTRTRAQPHRPHECQRRIRVNDATERNLAFAVSEPPSGHPTGVAAAIHIATLPSGERRTQRQVAAVAGVTEITIRNRSEERAERLEIDIVL